MVRLLKLLLTYKVKAKQPSQKTAGFTLIEVLVGLILAALIITPLLGFMVNILQSDRQEQAKATTEQEIQAALNYIARDLDQAIFMYDGLGLSAITADLPTVTNGTPILAFWKRKFLEGAITVPGGRDDAYAYSLVAYYLIKDPNCTAATWSCAAQIGRHELKAPVPTTQGGVGQNYRPNIYLFNPSPTGALATASLEEKMNAWPNPNPPTPNSPAPNLEQPGPVQILLDYVDQTAPTGVTNLCPTNGRPAPRPDVPTPQQGVNYELEPYANRQVPPPAALTAAGFYACIDTDKNIAKVFMRGNALARMGSRTNPPSYSPNKSSYFPSASIQVKGRGFLGNNEN